jgi:hypothetical protein
MMDSMVMYLAFLVMAGQMFVTYLEYYIIGVLGIILMPFAVKEKFDNMLNSKEFRSGIAREFGDFMKNYGIFP